MGHRNRKALVLYYIGDTISYAAQEIVVTSLLNQQLEVQGESLDQSLGIPLEWFTGVQLVVMCSEDRDDWIQVPTDMHSCTVVVTGPLTVKATRVGLHRIPDRGWGWADMIIYQPQKSDKFATEIQEVIQSFAD